MADADQQRNFICSGKHPRLLPCISESFSISEKVLLPHHQTLGFIGAMHPSTRDVFITTASGAHLELRAIDGVCPTSACFLYRNLLVRDPPTEHFPKFRFLLLPGMHDAEFLSRLNAQADKALTDLEQ